MTFLNDYFGFTKQQRNGLLVLLFISFVLLLIRLVYPLFIHHDPVIVTTLPLGEGPAAKNNFKEVKTKPALFVFDPNTVSMDQLLKLGFSEKKATTFIKYRSKGGRFREKTDLQKVYGITPSFYKTLEPYVLIQDQSRAVKEPLAKTLAQSVQKIELNAADSTALVALNGIGPAFARRIIKYRNILGGYTSVEQLKEVYGFTDELFQKIKAHVTVDAGAVKKIDLNKDDFKTVNKHPYLSYEITKIIFDRRRKTPINAVNLKEIISNDTLYSKLLPYLQLN